MEIFSSIVGWTGATFVLVAYFLVSTKKVTGDSKLYQFMNIVGAVGVAINSYLQAAYPSVGIQVVWIAIGVFALLKIARPAKS